MLGKNPESLSCGRGSGGTHHQFALAFLLINLDVIDKHLCGKGGRNGCGIGNSWKRTANCQIENKIMGPVAKLFRIGPADIHLKIGSLQIVQKHLDGTWGPDKGKGIVIVQIGTLGSGPLGTIAGVISFVLPVQSAVERPILQTVGNTLSVTGLQDVNFPAGGPSVLGAEHPKSRPETVFQYGQLYPRLYFPVFYGYFSAGLYAS